MARPRDPSVEPRIQAAARELLAAGGYDALTMEAVATRAGVGKPTVYRRWSTRAQLVFELLAEPTAPDELPDTGSFERDLTEIATWMTRSMAETDRKVMGDRLGEMVANREFSHRVSERRLGPDRDVLLPLWHRALQRGEVQPDVDGAAVLDDLVGILTYRVLIRHEEPDSAEIGRLVERHVAAVRPRSSQPV